MAAMNIDRSGMVAVTDRAMIGSGPVYMAPIDAAGANQRGGVMEDGGPRYVFADYEAPMTFPGRPQVATIVEAVDHEGTGEADGPTEAELAEIAAVEAAVETAHPAEPAQP